LKFYRNGLYQEAYDLYNELLDSTDPVGFLPFIQRYTNTKFLKDTEEHSDIITNLQAAQKHLDFINNDYLRSVDALPASIANSIETAPPPAPPSSILTVRSPTAQQQPSIVPPQKTRAVRKSRVPPGVIPGITPPPDPERWLKKSERSTYNQGRRRRGGGGGATQGSAVLDAPVVISATTPKAGKGKRKK
jgi:signal recognition particle subunit SRP72